MTDRKAEKFKTSGVPILANSGPSMEKVYQDFIYLSLKSQDTQKTYYFATTNFLNFCFSNGIEDIRDVEPVNVRQYLDHRIQIEQKEASSPTHFYAIKAMFQYFVDSKELTINPAASVNYAFKRSKKGRTGVITRDQVRHILLSIPCSTDDPDNLPKETDMRDRALIALMAYTFARIGGVLSAKVGDYYFDDGEMWLDMTEKGAKEHFLPVTGAAREYMGQYIEYCNLKDNMAPLFQSANRNGKLSGKPYDRINSRRMIIARAKRAGLEGKISNHTFRATGITRFLEGGGSIEDAMDIANHSHIDTTKRYDRRDRKRLISALKTVDY